jgi:hypothetical protein
MNTHTVIINSSLGTTAEVNGTLYDKYGLYKFESIGHPHCPGKNEWVEVIVTGFQSGAEYQLIRDWDGVPSTIGSVQPRMGRANGNIMTVRPCYSL